MNVNIRQYEYVPDSEETSALSTEAEVNAPTELVEKVLRERFNVLLSQQQQQQHARFDNSTTSAQQRGFLPPLDLRSVVAEQLLQEQNPNSSSSRPTLSRQHSLLARELPAQPAAKKMSVLVFQLELREALLIARSRSTTERCSSVLHLCISPRAESFVSALAVPHRLRTLRQHLWSGSDRKFSAPDSLSATHKMRRLVSLPAAESRLSSRLYMDLQPYRDTSLIERTVSLQAQAQEQKHKRVHSTLDLQLSGAASSRDVSALVIGIEKREPSLQRSSLDLTLSPTPRIAERQLSALVVPIEQQLEQKKRTLSSTLDIALPEAPSSGRRLSALVIEHKRKEISEVRIQQMQKRAEMPATESARVERRTSLLAELRAAGDEPQQQPQRHRNVLLFPQALHSISEELRVFAAEALRALEECTTTVLATRTQRSEQLASAETPSRSVAHTVSVASVLGTAVYCTALHCTINEYGCSPSLLDLFTYKQSASQPLTLTCYRFFRARSRVSQTTEHA